MGFSNPWLITRGRRMQVKSTVSRREHLRIEIDGKKEEE